MKCSKLIGVSSLALAALWAPSAHASGGYFPLPCMIQAPAAYTGGGILYANGGGVTDLRIDAFGGCTPLPPGPGTVLANGPCIATLRLGSVGGVVGTATAPAMYTTRITRTGAQTFDTELLQLSIGGGTLPPNVRIREDVGLPSFGQMTVVPQGGGYQIDSFFDIFTELSLDGGFTWAPSLGSTRIILSGPCYANCDQSAAAPVLNVIDFACFLNHFAAGDPYANCDGSSTVPVLNVSDFACFLNKFAAGCT